MARKKVTPMDEHKTGHAAAHGHAKEPPKEPPKEPAPAHHPVPAAPTAEQSKHLHDTAKGKGARYGQAKAVECCQLLTDVLEAIIAFEAENPGVEAARLFLPRRMAWDLARLPDGGSFSTIGGMKANGVRALGKLYGLQVILTAEDDFRVEGHSSVTK